MSKSNPLELVEHRLPINKYHRLTKANAYTEKRGNTVYRTQWLNESGENDALVSRIRTWTNETSRPPYRKQVGWERYSPTGELLEREVRYSKRADNEWLH